jgi:hypothetical protein
MERNFLLIYIFPPRRRGMFIYPEEFIFTICILYFPISCRYEEFLKKWLFSSITNIERDISFFITIKRDILLRSNREKIRFDANYFYLTFLKSSELYKFLFKYIKNLSFLFLLRGDFFYFVYQ